MKIQGHSLGISADASSAARELRRLQSLLRQVEEPTKRLESQTALLNASLGKGHGGT